MSSFVKELKIDRIHKVWQPGNWVIEVVGPTRGFVVGIAALLDRGVSIDLGWVTLIIWKRGGQAWMQ